MGNLSRLGGDIAPLALALVGAMVATDSAEGKIANNLPPPPIARGSFHSDHCPRCPISQSVRNGVGQLTLPMGAMGPDTDDQLGVLYYNSGVPTADRTIGEMREHSVGIVLENINLRDELKDTHAQIAGLMMEIDLLKQGCVDSTQEDGCPAGCVYDGYASVKNGCPEGYECATSVMHMVEKQGTTQEPRPYQWHD